jgi:hypothetical protein
VNDSERINWLEKHAGHGGALVGVVHNDARHWAVLWDGFQNVPADSKEPFPLQTAFCADEDDLHRFKLTVREAIDYASENIP